VYLDGTLLIDQWKDQPPTTCTASRLVTAGTHEVMVEYYEHTEGAVAALRSRHSGSGLAHRRVRVGSADVRV
jgi:hypothetical protein